MSGVLPFAGEVVTIRLMFLLESLFSLRGRGRSILILLPLLVRSFSTVFTKLFCSLMTVEILPCFEREREAMQQKYPPKPYGFTSTTFPLFLVEIDFFIITGKRFNITVFYTEIMQPDKIESKLSASNEPKSAILGCAHRRGSAGQTKEKKIGFRSYY